MNRKILLAAVLASTLGGCATYDYVGNTAPGGYYSGRPTTQYYDYGAYGSYGPYGGGYVYPGSSVYLGIGSGYYPGYYGYRRYPYYGYYNPHYPNYPRPPRPPRPDHDGDDRPPGPSQRPPPWRDPTGAWREGGQIMVPPRSDANPGRPQQSQPGRVMAQPSAPRVRGEMPTAAPRSEMSQPSRRAERPMSSPSAPRMTPRSERGVREQEP